VAAPFAVVASRCVHAATLPRISAIIDSPIQGRNLTV
jgi:hypothetical protein